MIQQTCICLPRPRVAWLITRKRETNNLIWRIAVACRYDLCSRNTYVQCFSRGLRSSAVTEAVTLPLTFGSDGTKGHMSVTKTL